MVEAHFVFTLVYNDLVIPTEAVVLHIKLFSAIFVPCRRIRVQYTRSPLDVTTTLHTSIYGSVYQSVGYEIKKCSMDAKLSLITYLLLRFTYCYAYTHTSLFVKINSLKHFIGCCELFYNQSLLPRVLKQIFIVEFVQFWDISKTASYKCLNIHDSNNCIIK